jgi:uridine phosphorylase
MTMSLEQLKAIELHEGVQPKEAVVETGVPRRIEKISFGIMDSVEIMNAAEFQVFERALYKVR